MAGYLEVARTEDAVYVRVTGLGNFNSAGPLREYCELAFNDGRRCVIVDLAQCTGLDSTFMGTLMGFTVWGTAAPGADKAVAVTVVNATATTMRAMSSLGLPEILHVKREDIDFPPCKLQRLREGWQDRRARTRLVRDAHLHLIHADKENEARFGPFVAALIKEAREHVDDESSKE